MNRKSNNVNKFWLSYRDAVMASGIPEKAAEWYAHWAQKFAVSIKEGKRGPIDDTRLAHSYSPYDHVVHYTRASNLADRGIKNTISSMC